MAYGDIYTLKHAAAFSSAITIAQIKPGAAAPVEILRAMVSLPAATTGALIDVQWVRKSAAATVTAAAIGTHLFKNQGGPDPSVSLGTTATGVTASGEGTDTESFGRKSANVFGGAWEWVRIAEGELIVPGGAFLGLKFASAPASGTYAWEIVFKELG